ncbi:hypothetical protein V5799_023888 [Amblyomma americanum]|uniref:EGF-like domain-containing protein n=1 Tax=Amblyomma americanum TaxID=6943 RepID=A0AAQ4FI06_AMBAM
MQAHRWAHAVVSMAAVALFRQSAGDEATDFEDFYGRQNASTVAVCEAIRDRAPVGTELLFSCGLMGGLLSGVFWEVKPEHCCSLTEVYRATPVEPRRENADVQLTLKANSSVEGHVRALVVGVDGHVYRDATMQFVVSDDAGCRCRRHYMRCNASGACACPPDRPNYDPVHGVCGNSVPKDGVCRYHHQCQWNHSGLECVRGRCDCGHRMVRDESAPCVPAAGYGERCAVGKAACVAAGTACGREGRCFCARGYERLREGCVPLPAAPTVGPRQLLGADWRRLSQYSFYAVCTALLALACLARMTSRVARWLLGRPPSVEQSVDTVETYSPRPITAGLYDRPLELRCQKPMSETGL